MSLNTVQALTVTIENDGTGANAKTARTFWDKNVTTQNYRRP